MKKIILNMPKLHYGSRGGVYYRKNGRKVYVNRFGNNISDQIERFRKLYFRLIKPVIDRILIYSIFEIDDENNQYRQLPLMDMNPESFYCKEYNRANKDTHCLVIMGRCRLLMEIMIDPLKWKFFC